VFLTEAQHAVPLLARCIRIMLVFLASHAPILGGETDDGRAIKHIRVDVVAQRNNRHARRADRSGDDPPSPCHVATHPHRRVRWGWVAAEEDHDVAWAKRSGGYPSPRVVRRVTGQVVGCGARHAPRTHGPGEQRMSRTQPTRMQHARRTDHTTRFPTPAHGGHGDHTHRDGHPPCPTHEENTPSSVAGGNSGDGSLAITGISGMIDDGKYGKD